MKNLKTFSVLIAPDIFRALEKYPPLEMFGYAEFIPESYKECITKQLSVTH